MSALLSPLRASTLLPAVAGRLACFFALCLSVDAQAPGILQVDWHTLDGGGGQFAGGLFVVRGTAGQTDAALLSGGSYAFQGGFWSVDTMPGLHPPRLIIQLTDSQIIVSWPSSAEGFFLQQTSNLVNQPWEQVPGQPVDDGTSKSLTLPVAPRTMFYRLAKR